MAQVQQLAADSISPITDVRATGKYRRQIVSVLVRRAFEKVLGWNQA